MTTISENILEENLIKQLQELNYTRVAIQDEAALIDNLKAQLEKHNNVVLSVAEFKQIQNQLSKGNIYAKAQTLRDKILYTKDTGEAGYIELINQIHWCKNQYQVTNQITMNGMYENRYDVTILINGLPLVQIELKRQGLELKEAFNQTNRYQRHSYGAGAGLFQYIQLFVISNGVNTKYYANNKQADLQFKQTFYWTDTDNNQIRNLSEFAAIFLEPCHLSKMITKYVVLNTANTLMVLRPYQYYATEAIIDRVKNTKKYGYIWHTTGSGKTLTSFKTAQILTNLDTVHKVVFVVDRKDLDYQTIKEFNSFSAGSIDATTNTSTLVKQLADDTKLVVTTIQKLNTAIEKTKYLSKMEALRDKRIVFIFDECHRSQFGDTHNRIKSFFLESQMFGFTGTPILADNSVKNALGERTTKDLFDECLHKYVITDAIRDRNVLRFSIEYIRTFKSKDGIIDLKVDDIDTAEVLDAPERLNEVADFIIANHNRKTHDRKFTAIFCVSSTDALIEYYKLFQQKKEAGLHDLRIATIFSYGANEEIKNADGMFIPDEDFSGPVANDAPATYESKHKREHLEQFIADYNKMYGMNYSTNEFYAYYKDVGKRVKAKQVDILLVVNMFLTGFDSKPLNTIYVDKNLRYHGLIQAFSRTNRILDEVKSQGNVVCFRNLKAKTDEAITLFSNKEAIEEVVVQPYEDYVKIYNEAVQKVLDVAVTYNDVDSLESEVEELEYIKAFRELMRAKNVLDTFIECDYDDLDMDEQTFANYKSKYLDLYQTVKNETKKEKVSILNDIDFELELIRRDNVNVAYILTLLTELYGQKPKDRAKKIEAISAMIDGEVTLRSKKELIERFIDQHVDNLSDTDDIEDAFDVYQEFEKQKALKNFVEQENLDIAKVKEVLSSYQFTRKEPLRDEVIGLMVERPSLKDRATAAERITDKIKDFVETYVDGL